MEEFNKSTTRDMDTFMVNQSTLAERSAEIDRVVNSLKRDAVFNSEYKLWAISKAYC